MSKIDDLMKQLQEKKTAIEAYNLIADSLGKTLEDKKFDEIREDVSGKVAEFLIGEIESVEEDATQPAQIQATPANLEGLSQDQLTALVQVADKVMGKGTVPNNSFAEEGAPKIRQRPRKEAPGGVDPVRFAMQNRHLENKKVSVTTPNGVVNGTVRGLVAPYIIVETDTGQELEVTLDTIQVKGA